MTTILLNADYSFLGSVDWERAVTLVTKKKVEVLKNSGRLIRNFEGTVKMYVPLVMKLIKLVRTLYRTRVPWSKRNVIIRDKFTCAYCGTHQKKLTIDHIIPSSRGGKSTFENCVAACKKCNSKKGNKTPREINMYPRHKAYQPTISEFMSMKLKSSGIDKMLKEFGIY
jgi:5-methylcytosine-specific restriction endonuclease McrA